LCSKKQITIPNFLKQTNKYKTKMHIMKNIAVKIHIGGRTFSPGQWLYQAPKHCECCAPTPAAAPFGPRKTIGTFTYMTKMLQLVFKQLHTL
jgi:hypothetical protein